MKKHVILIVFLAFSATVQAFNFFNYDVYYCGAKGYGAGGAYVSIADDSSAVFWNPAGLVQQRQPVVTYMLDAQFILNNIRDTLNPVFKVNYIPGLITFLWPFRDTHKIVLGICEFTPVQRKIDDDFNIYEIAVPCAMMPIPRLSVGISPALLLATSFSREIPVGFGFQAGAQYRLLDNLQWGLVFRSPFTMTWKTEDVQEKFPMVIQTGITYRVSPDLCISYDMEYQDWPGISFTSKGIEKTPDFETGFLYTWIPHFGIMFNEKKSGAQVRLGYIGRPFMDTDSTGQHILIPQHLLTFGISAIAEKINLTVDAVLVDSYLFSLIPGYNAPSYQEVIQITAEYRFDI